jgi:periplasmic protein CpxP/Spy
MGRQWRRAAFGLILGGLSVARCVGQNVAPPSGQTPATAPHRTLEGQAELRRLTMQFGLTPEQREKLRPIVTDEGDQLSAVRLDEHLTLEQRRAKTAEIKNAFDPKIAAVLTPEQQEKWKKMQEAAPAPAPSPATAPKQP